MRQAGTGEELVRQPGTGSLRDSLTAIAGADCAAAAALLLGACLQHAFLTSFAQRTADPEAVAEFAASVAETLVTGLADMR